MEARHCSLQLVSTGYLFDSNQHRVGETGTNRVVNGAIEVWGGLGLAAKKTFAFFFQRKAKVLFCTDPMGVATWGEV